MTIKKICSVEGCEKYVSNRGYCQRHYYHIKRYGCIRVKTAPVMTPILGRPEGDFDRAERIVRAPDTSKYTPNTIIKKVGHAEVILLNKVKKEAGRVLIDFSDIDVIFGYRWGLRQDKHTGYAVSQAKGGDPLIKMHRLILGLQDPKTLVDHINHNGLDNRKANLRIVNFVGNSCNSRPATGGRSPFKGVYWNKVLCKWYAQVTACGKRYFLGLFINETEAALAYDRAAVELHGEFAYLNFPFLW